MSEFGLFGYQAEVVERAVQGENIIIWLPTGGGKTRAAVYVAKRHLERTPKAKVVMLVNKVHLVDQHYTDEFKPHLGRSFRLVPVSGDCDEKDFFGSVLKDSDLVICTAQILENALINQEENKHVELSDITLLIIDECHHTQKEAVYNQIMRRYVEKKLKGEKPLPQILGLTASLGAGGARTLEKAVEHVLQICSNLDSAVVSSKHCATELATRVPRPIRRFDIVETRLKDPFGDELKWMMGRIHESMTLSQDFHLRDPGTQEYEADVVLLEEKGIREKNRAVTECARHLRQYNNALLINETLRMRDAYRLLDDFYESKSNRSIDETDRLLMALFQENQAELKRLSEDDQFENPKMERLQTTLLEHFGPGRSTRAILFTKTRISTRCLYDWVRCDPALQEADIRADILIGAGTGTSYMTQKEQRDTIRSFHAGTLNLLISTSVAEEGLSNPECNLVVRYGLLTNEIAQQQASGRTRAEGSVYSVVGVAGGREMRREEVNDFLEKLSVKAISRIQEMSLSEFRRKLTELQQASMLCRLRSEGKETQRRSRFLAADVQLICRNCFKAVASGSDIKLVDKVHYANVNPAFQKLYKTGVQVSLARSFEDWEPGQVINCGNGNCNQKWGFEIKYRKAALLPILSIGSFALETPEGRTTAKKWKKVPFTADDFDFHDDYCRERFEDLLT